MNIFLLLETLSFRESHLNKELRSFHSKQHIELRSGVARCVEIWASFLHFLFKI